MKHPYLLSPRDDTPLSEVIKVLNLLVAGNRSVLYFEPLSAEPSVKGEGALSYADGVGWDPGDGAGFYRYTDGAWVKL